MIFALAYSLIMVLIMIVIRDGEDPRYIKSMIGFNRIVKWCLNYWNYRHFNCLIWSRYKFSYIDPHAIETIEKEVVIAKISGVLWWCHAALVISYLRKGIDVEVLIVLMGLLVLLVFIPELQIEKLMRQKRATVEGAFSSYLLHYLILCKMDSVVERNLLESIDGMAEDTVFNRALIDAGHKLNLGVDIYEVLSSLAYQLKNVWVNRWINILMNGKRYGDRDLFRQLKLLYLDRLDYEKNEIKRKCEQATTQLVLPTSLMVVAVIMIIVYPGLRLLI